MQLSFQQFIEQSDPDVLHTVFSPHLDGVSFINLLHSSKTANDLFVGITPDMIDLFTITKYVMHFSENLSVESRFITTLHGKQETYYESGELSNLTTFTKGVKDGPCNSWFDNGVVWTTQNYKNGKLDGESSAYWKNGQFFFTENYIDGKIQDEVISYNSKGGIQGIVSYVDGKPDGEQVIYAPNGQLIHQWTWKNGEKVAQTNWSSDGKQY